MFETLGEEVGSMLDPIIIPDIFSVIWVHYRRMSPQRQNKNPLSWSDIAAYCSLKKISFNKYELTLIQALDDIWYQAMHGEEKPSTVSTL